MSGGEEATGELERISARLRELASQLGDESLDDDRAVELAREAAELSSRAGTAAADAIREAAESRPDRDDS